MVTANTVHGDAFYDRDLELENITARFISGEINLDEYRMKIGELELDTRVDLRRTLKLKPILSRVKTLVK